MIYRRPAVISWAEVQSNISQHDGSQVQGDDKLGLSLSELWHEDAEAEDRRLGSWRRRRGSSPPPPPPPPPPSTSATDYLKNIGKALYGYNAYYGEPASSNSAGTDPGWQHRPVWAASYVQRNVVQMKEYTSFPRYEEPGFREDITPTKVS